MPRFPDLLLIGLFWSGFSIGEISNPTRYFPDASSIAFGPSVHYGRGVLRLSAQSVLKRVGPSAGK